MYYDDIEYASRRLTSTLVRKANGAPFYVIAVTKIKSDTICSGSNTLTNSIEDVNLREIDLTPVPLGFVNYEGQMGYACRRPMRKDWKQGLSQTSLNVYGIDKRRLNLVSLSDTVLGKYPTLKDSIEHVKLTRGAAMAFSRDFGLTNSGKEIELIYRKYPVGKLVDQTLVLNPDKFFLEQHLTEAMG